MTFGPPNIPQTSDDWERFVRVAYPYLWTIARRMGVPSQSSEDLIQSSLCHALFAIRRGTYEPDKSPLLNFTAMILRGYIRKWYRESRRREKPLIATHEPNNDSGIEAILLAEENEHVGKALRYAYHALPESDQRIYDSRIAFGMSWTEVGNVLGIPAQKLRNRWTHIMNAIERSMRDFNPSLFDYPDDGESE